MKRNLLLTLMMVMCLTYTSFAQERQYLLSSHILDITTGFPAQGVKIVLSKQNQDKTWYELEERITDKNGRVRDFLEQKENVDHAGIYKLTYHVGPYFKQQSQDTFYPFIEVVFEIKDGSHYHVPITLSPFGYSTYRGN